MFFAKKWNLKVELLWNFFVEVQVELLGNSISLYFSFFNGAVALTENNR